MEGSTIMSYLAKVVALNKARLEVQSRTLDDYLDDFGCQPTSLDTQSASSSVLSSTVEPNVYVAREKLSAPTSS